MGNDITIDVHQERPDETHDERAWPYYRWMCSECGHTELADTSSQARTTGNQHIADKHGTP